MKTRKFTPNEVGAIVSAHTGILCCNFSILHKYAEEILERPIWTHEFGRKEVSEELKEKSKADFLELAEWCSEVKNEN